jgi:hypothetical protein|tara:strand:+ start:231 stop:362 length:132 start_codon:yes stop_codon:yes gene_type:complete
MFINQDPIMFSLSQDNDKEALEIIDKVYHHSENRQDILEKLKN